MQSFSHLVKMGVVAVVAVVAVSFTERKGQKQKDIFEEIALG